MEEQTIGNDPFDSGILRRGDIRRFDGTGNHTDPILRTIGGVGTRYRRTTPIAFADGLQAPAGSDRPSARVVSNTVGAQDGELTNARFMTDFIWNFGQFVNHDTDLALEGAEDPEHIAGNRDIDFPIPIPEDDPVFGPNGTNPMPGGQFRFERDAFAPETGTTQNNVPGAAINTITAWLDLSTVYGSDPELDRSLQGSRRFRGVGMLSIMETPTGDLLPPDTDGLTGGGAFMGVGFLAGDVRANENDGLASQHTLWVRNHNRLANALAAAHPDWDGNRIFQRARQINIAQYQNIVLYEWLPALLGSQFLTPYAGYDEGVDPQTTDTFAVAALRIGHTLVSPTVRRRDANGDPLPEGDIAFLNSFGAGNITEGEDVDEILRGISTGLAQEIDTKVHDVLRNGLPELGPVGFDLLSANIQRGRDRGLTDYNTLRRTLAEFSPELGIGPVDSFDDITSDPELQQSLETLYGTVDNIDMWVGLMAEDKAPGASVGLTEAAVLATQYQEFRDGDRYWFENVHVPGEDDSGFFTPEEIAEIRATRLSDIIERNTSIDAIQDNVFFLAQTGTDGDDTINGGVGDDTILAGAGNDVVNANPGADIILGLNGNDTIDGGSGNDILAGNIGNDLINGGAGADTVFGGQNEDIVSGGDGNDHLWGDRGNDTLTGGNGADSFRFGGAGLTVADLGVDAITDFTPGEDKIVVDDATFTLVSAGETLTSFGVFTSAAEGMVAEALFSYNSTTGNVYYNPNGAEAGFGDGGGRFATLQPGLAVTASDFSIA